MEGTVFNNCKFIKCVFVNTKIYAGAKQSSFVNSNFSQCKFTPSLDNKEGVKFFDCTFD